MASLPPAVPLRRVHAALARAMEQRDGELLATMAPLWRPSRNRPTLVEFAMQQIDGDYALAELVRLGYPVSPQAVYHSLVWMKMFSAPDASLVAWNALRASAVGRLDCLAAVVRGLEKISRPSLVQPRRVVPWEELNLDGMFEPAQWQVPIKRVHAVYSARATSSFPLLSLTPLQYAWAVNRPALCEAFIRAGAPVDEPAASSWRGWTFNAVVVEQDASPVAGPHARRQVQDVLDQASTSKATYRPWADLLERLPALLRHRALDQRLPVAEAPRRAPRF